MLPLQAVLAHTDIQSPSGSVTDSSSGSAPRFGFCHIYQVFNVGKLLLFFIETRVTFLTGRLRGEGAGWPGGVHGGWRCGRGQRQLIIRFGFIFQNISTDVTFLVPVNTEVVSFYMMFQSNQSNLVPESKYRECEKGRCFTTSSSEMLMLMFPFWRESLSSSQRNLISRCLCLFSFFSILISVACCELYTCSDRYSPGCWRRRRARPDQRRRRHRSHSPCPPPSVAAGCAQYWGRLMTS